VAYWAGTDTTAFVRVCVQQFVMWAGIQPMASAEDNFASIDVNTRILVAGAWGVI